MTRLTTLFLIGCLFWVACSQEPSKEAMASAAETALWAKYKTEGWKNHGCELIKMWLLDSSFMTPDQIKMYV